ncbi:hypothetical protein ACQP04_34480 [Pseudonocardia halophobica]|uniref:hypothetical protein n=1 Tax=Pseudonocardia halophobica TaxID=29401 RepID=UPI003D8A55D4
MALAVSVLSSEGHAVREIFRRFGPDARPFRRRMAVVLLLVVVTPFLDAAVVWLFKLLIDDVLAPRNFAAFPALAAYYVGAPRSRPRRTRCGWRPRVPARPRSTGSAAS